MIKQGFCEYCTKIIKVLVLYDKQVLGYVDNMDKIIHMFIGLIAYDFKLYTELSTLSTGYYVGNLALFSCQVRMFVLVYLLIYDKNELLVIYDTKKVKMNKLSENY